MLRYGVVLEDRGAGTQMFVAFVLASCRCGRVWEDGRVVDDRNEGVGDGVSQG